jgi:hypothetical protein
MWANMEDLVKTQRRELLGALTAAVGSALWGLDETVDDQLPRVGDLDKMTGQLEAAGIAVKMDPTTYPNGRFARVHYPAGNPMRSP